MPATRRSRACRAARPSSPSRPMTFTPSPNWSAATLAADQFGDGVNVIGREGDDGRAARQARDLLVAGICQLRQARARHEIGARQQFAYGSAHGRRTEQQSLVQAARVKQAVGEHVSALAVGGKLDLVYGDEIGF